MKKSIVTMVLVFSMGALSAQTTPPPADSRTKTTTVQQSNQPPSSVTTRFNTDYPNMRSNWSASGTNYRAEYTDPATKRSNAVIYDMNGNPVGMEKEISKGEYPGTINDYYSKTYPNEQYRVWSREENGKQIYYVPRNSEQLMFDDKGNYTPMEINKKDSPK